MLLSALPCAIVCNQSVTTQGHLFEVHSNIFYSTGKECAASTVFATFPDRLMNICQNHRPHTNHYLLLRDHGVHCYINKITNLCYTPYMIFLSFVSLHFSLMG